MGGIVSVQVLNEFPSVARRKIRMPWAEVGEASASIRKSCGPRPITAQTHETVLRIAEQSSDSGSAVVDRILTHPIQKLVPSSGQGQKPRPPVVQPQRRPRKRNLRKGVLRLIPCH
jgi:hypothetical protein